MATVNLFAPLADLNDWPGNLLRADGTTKVDVHSKTAFDFTLGAGSDFEGYTVHVAGKGFSYVGGKATDGIVTGLTIKDATGHNVISISGLKAGTLASDFAQIYSDMFGWKTADGDKNPDGERAFTHLLSGDDTFVGTSGDDSRYLAGLDAGNDIYKMGAGDDYVEGGLGNDKYFGGAGNDVLDYSETGYSSGLSALHGVSLNVQKGSAVDSWGGHDRFTGFEEFRGSVFDDKLVGSNTERDYFTGYRGHDILDGGADTFDKDGHQTSDSRDELSYGDEYWKGGTYGIVARLETKFDGHSIVGRVRDGFGQFDKVIDFERVSGTRFGDKFYGSHVGNTFNGGEGKDYYDGGDGEDMIGFGRYFGDKAPGPVKVDLAKASGQVIDDGFGNQETAKNIEDLYGAQGNDVLKGDAQGNFLGGSNGADIMTGRGGRDIFYWDGDYEVDKKDRVTDFHRGQDHLAFWTVQFDGMSNSTTLVNGTAATSSDGQFVFDAASHTLFWDADGTGSGGKEAIVTLDNVNALSISDVLLWT